MSLEGKLLSAVLNDKQIHVLMQGNVDQLLVTHGDIWGYIRSYYDSYGGLPTPDIVIDKHPDFDYVSETQPTKYYLDELRSERLDDGVRTIIKRAAGVVQEGKPGQALDALITNAVKLKQMASPVRDVDVSDADSAVSHMENVIKLRESGSLGIRIGIPEFDVCLPQGIYPGHFGVLLAYPAIGKSWIMAWLAVKAWRAGKTAMIFSLEMTEEEVRDRIYTIIGNGYFSHRKLSSGNVDLEDFKRWHKNTFSGMPPIHIIAADSGAVTPSVVQGKIDQYRPDIVFLDYLNLMSSNEKADSETVKMKQLSTQLKVLAKNTRVPIVAISSATPDDATDMNSAPMLGQVSWSKQISYDADWLIALGREANSSVLVMIFRKNRHGMLGEFALDVDFDKGQFGYIRMPD